MILETYRYTFRIDKESKYPLDKQFEENIECFNLVNQKNNIEMFYEADYKFVHLEMSVNHFENNKKNIELIKTQLSEYVESIINIQLKKDYSLDYFGYNEYIKNVKIPNKYENTTLYSKFKFKED